VDKAEDVEVLEVVDVAATGIAVISNRASHHI
jgi:hypothetical protein